MGLRSGLSAGVGHQFTASASKKAFASLLVYLETMTIRKTGRNERKQSFRQNSIDVKLCIHAPSEDGYFWCQPKHGLYKDALLLPFVLVAPTYNEKLFSHAIPFELNFHRWKSRRWTSHLSRNTFGQIPIASVDSLLYELAILRPCGQPSQLPPNSLHFRKGKLQAKVRLYHGLKTWRC